MVYFKSKYPLPPPVPDANVHELMFPSRIPEWQHVPDYTIHVDAISGRKRSFYEFRELVRDGATALGARVSEGGMGLSGQAGDIVGIYSHNCMNYVALLHSLLVITTPIALLSAYGTPYELAHSLRTAQPTRLFVEPGLLPNARAAAKEVGLPESCIYILEGKVEGKISFEDLVNDIRRRKTPRVPVRPASRTTLAYLVMSSGTTGLPKAVMITHGNIWAMMVGVAMLKEEEDKITKPVPPSEPPVGLMFLPFYHTYGLHMTCFKLFVVPATALIVPRWDTEFVLKAIPKFRVNWLPLIPSAIHQLLNHPLMSKIDWSTVTNLSSGAAYLPPALADKILKFVQKPVMVYEGYGMSEQTLSVTRKPYPGVLGLQPKRGSVGILYPGVEGRILRADGSEADDDEPGELWVRGSNIALGYYRNEKATKATFVNGWLRTGDHFRVDKDGFLFFVDRAKDTLKVSGVQVSPTEVEDTLMAHPDRLLQDVCVAGVSGGRTSDEKNPRAWLVLSEAGKLRGEQQTVKALDEWARKNLSRYKWLRGGYEVLEAIPKSPTGKVLRRVLQDQHERRVASETQAKL